MSCPPIKVTPGILADIVATLEHDCPAQVRRFEDFVGGFVIGRGEVPYAYELALGWNLKIGMTDKRVTMTPREFCSVADN